MTTLITKYILNLTDISGKLTCASPMKDYNKFKNLLDFGLTIILLGQNRPDASSLNSFIEYIPKQTNLILKILILNNFEVSYASSMFWHKIQKMSKIVLN
jgi:hypothetical protein